MNRSPGSAHASSDQAAFVGELIAICRAGLPEMFLPKCELFAFRRRRHQHQIVLEGESYRYTAIVLLGLSTQPPDVAAQVLHGRTPAGLCRRLIREIDRVTNLGDVALTLWAASLFSLEESKLAAQRLITLKPVEERHYTVELAWALSALCRMEEPDSTLRTLRRDISQRLIGALHPRARIFPHRVSGGGSLRGHVSCFADQVYPIQALSYYAQCAGDDLALQAANHAALRICEQMGPSGQWWWHYDWRTGRVTEGYPVYSVHQNSMAPMALFALHEAGGADFRPYIAKGLAWLRSTPELGGRSLVDPENRVIWRKVARREPGKLTRQVQAGMSRIHPALRAPAMDRIFPARAVDWECRPYHLGWILYTWTAQRLAARPASQPSQLRPVRVATASAGAV